MREPLSEHSELPLVFDNHEPTTIHPAQFSSADVVESLAIASPGLHPQLTTAGSRVNHATNDNVHDYVDVAPADHVHDHDHDHDHDHSPHRDEYDAEVDNRNVGHGPDLEPDHDLDLDLDHNLDHEPATHDDDQRAAHALLRIDHDERRRERAGRRKLFQRTADPRRTRRDHSPPGTRPVGPSRHPRRQHDPPMWFAFRRTHQHRANRRESELQPRHQHRDRGAHHVDSQRRAVNTFATGPLQGMALTLYFVLLPYVLTTKWRFSYTVTDGALLRDLLVGLGIFWTIFLVLLVVYVNQLRHRRHVPANGCAWLAGLVIAALPFLVSSSAGAATSSHLAHPASMASTTVEVTTARLTPPGGAVGADLNRSLRHDGVHPEQLFTLALIAKGRRDRLRGAPTLDDDDLDELARRLSDGDAQLVARLRNVVGSERDGEALVTGGAVDVEPSLEFDPVVVSLLGEHSDGFVLGYAREGGVLPVDQSWTDEEVTTRVVALHDGHVAFAQSDNELMRALARRRGLATMVVYLGDPSELDDELRDLCVTLRAASGSAKLVNSPGRQVRVELLRAFPQVQGLAHDFTATLRRRSVEMVAYLAMHGGEPITGDRLRTRVLVNANIDASKTTLSNTASSVRRSLGSDVLGPLLEPVSSGLYRVHGVGLDVANFHRLVARSRAAEDDDAYELYVEALRLVHGEPLASVLKGFEWFTFEGHRAQLQRDGEWAALALHEAALAREDVETAFWALRQGLLLDPDSDDLLDALERVPRLRQFGGNGSGASQHQPVRPGRAVAMSWAFERFGR